MNVIKNSEELLSVGDRESRKIVLSILDETLDQLNSYKLLKKMVRLDGDMLYIGNRSWDLSKKKNIYVIGAGKAANAMAQAFDEILGDRLTDGIVIVKIKEEKDNFKHIREYTGGHPLPNQSGFVASLEVLKMVDKATENDLFIGVMSGGCSSLMSCPMEGMTLKEEMQTRDIMLKSGANVIEVNAVCRHVSRVNGGHLAKRIEAKGAEMISLLIMDAIGFPPTKDPGEPQYFGATPMGPDVTTLEDAKAAIKNYNVEDKLPPVVSNFFKNCTEADETPKNLKRWTPFIINTLPDASNIAKAVAEKHGLYTMVLTNYLAGEAKEAGTFLANIAQEIQNGDQPIKAPCVVIATGEVSTKISPDEKIGLGGPGQELVASFAITAAKTKGVCIASVDTEGTDGPTDAAGGLTDSETFKEANEKGIDIYAALRKHSVHDALKALNCKIITGNTGTNLCDLHIMYVPKA